MSEDVRDKLRSGMEVRIHQKIREKNAHGEETERTQMFEGIILNRKHGTEKGATITVRKVSEGVGVEKIFPVYSPIIENIEILREKKVRKSNASYLRNHKKKLKDIEEDKQTA